MEWWFIFRIYLTVVISANFKPKVKLGLFYAIIYRGVLKTQSNI